jgi:hypothetical protein
MPETFAQAIGVKLHRCTAELRLLDSSLRSDPSLDTSALGELGEFRQALDNVRLAAWSVSELLNVRQIQENHQAMTEFLTTDSLRRFSQMDLDLARHSISWPTRTVRNLKSSLALLGVRSG